MSENGVPLGDERLHKLLAEIADLHDRKQADYGKKSDPFANVRASEDFGVAPWIGCMIRANDKMRRVQTMALSGTLVNESLEDSLMDLAVYSLIAIILHREQETTPQAPEGVHLRAEDWKLEDEGTDDG